MRTFNKIAIAAIAATMMTAGSAGVAGALPIDIFSGSLGSLGSINPGPVDPEVPAGPAVTLSKANGLAAAGETISVSGTGFSGEGDGLYVGLIQDDKYSATDSSAWMTTAWLKSADIVDGKWTVDVNALAVKGGSDCLVNSCSIYTVAARGSADRTQDTKTPVDFAPFLPTVTASKLTGLAAAGETITVSGSHFSGAGAGIYVGLVQDNQHSVTEAGLWHGTKFVQARQIVGGEWAVDIDVQAAFGTADCVTNTCSIYTMAAHGSPDRSQDTKTPVAFQ